MADRELMQQWLDAIAAIPEDVEGYLPDALTDVVIATRERLAQPEQEPKLSCGVDYADGLLTVSVVRGHADESMEVIHCEQIELPIKAQPQSRREWVGLTDEEIMDPWPFENRVEFARWVETKLREKNT